MRTIVSTLVGRVQASDAERARRKPPASLAAYECVLQGNALPWDDPEGARRGDAAVRAGDRARSRLRPGPCVAGGDALRQLVRRPGRVATRRCWRPRAGASARSNSIRTRAPAFRSWPRSACCAAPVRPGRCSYMPARGRAQSRATSGTPPTWGMVLVLRSATRRRRWSGSQRAREIDPYFDQPWYWRCLGQAHMLLHQYDEALAMFAHVPDPELPHRRADRPAAMPDWATWSRPAPPRRNACA